MIVWVVTDMEGLAGIDSWEQCYDGDDGSPRYQYGREQLTAEANAAIGGCFDGGASEVRLLDGHGRNHNRGFIPEKLDPRARRVWVAQHDPLRWEGLDETVGAMAIIGQHAMAGTLNAFLDHTMCPKEICRFTVNGQEVGEMGMLALYAGGWGVPLAYVSGDEALCAEARARFPHVVSTPTKRGSGWATCELYDPLQVRQNIRRDLIAALPNVSGAAAWRVTGPLGIEVEYAYSGLADRFAGIDGVQRPHARVVRWQIRDQRDILTWPCANWRPR